MNRSMWLLLLLWSCMNNCFEDSCDQELTWKNAYSCCRSRDQTLPNVYTAHDVHHVSASATENDLASVWVSLRKQRLSTWMWVDGVVESGPLASEHNIGDCALYIPATGETTTRNCDNSAVAFLCEIQDCNDCKCNKYLPTCVLHNNKSYVYLCRNMTWYKARAFCAHEGWRLAVVRGATLNKNPAKAACEKFWIGLRKKDWITSDEWEESSYTFWDKHEPLASGHCAVLTSTKSGWKLQAKSCQSKLPFICTKHEDSTTLQKHATEERNYVSEKGSFTTAPSGDYRRPHENVLIGGIIGGVGALILAFSGLMVCLIFIKKKRPKPVRTPLGEKSDTRLEDAIPLTDEYNSERKRIQQVLAKNMLQRFSKINLWSWFDDHVEVPMNQLYTDLVWTQTHDLQASGDHIVEYTEMFRLDGKDEPIANVFLVGEAGTGKSTFTKKIATDWCKLIHERRDDDTGLSSEGQVTMRNLEFVILLCLRDIKKGQRLPEAMRDQLNLTGEDANYLYQLIGENKEETLVIFDGYDEYRDATSQDITDILHRHSLQYTNLLITSRHPRSFHFPTGKHPPGNEVSLLGFSVEGTNDFIRKFFKGQNQEEHEKQLKEKIQESDYLAHLSRFPAVLLLMAILWRDTKTLSDTITGFYIAFVEYICGRYEKKFISKEQRAKPENIWKRYDKYLMKIGNIAVNGMKPDKLELAFYYEEVVKIIGQKGWDLGFFVRERIPGSQDTVFFPHKTLQEFFVAYFVVNTDKKKREKILLLFCDTTEALTQSEMIVTFISGLGGEEIHKYMQAIISGDGEKAEAMSNLQLKYLSQNPGARPVLPPVVTLTITTLKYPVSVFVNYLNSDISRLTRLVIQISFRKLKSNHLFQIIEAACKTRKLEEVMVRNEDLSLESNKGEILYSKENPIVNLLWNSMRKFTLIICNLSVDEIESLFNRMPGCQYLTHLDVSYNSIRQSLSYEDLPGIDMSPLATSHLTTLNMSHCKLTGYDIQSLIDHLPPSLTHLDVSQNISWLYLHSDINASPLATSQMTTLNMSLCDLTSTHILSVIDHLPPSLTHLDVSRNIAGDDFEDIVNRTDHMRSLRKLDLRFNHMSVNSMNKIRQTLSGACPELNLHIEPQDSINV